MPGEDASPTLVRKLGAWDAALVTIGSVLGTGIFITTGDVARVLPHAGLILLVWLAGGLLTLTGALTFAELGAMFPRAGGQYHFLKEAYGPLWGFLFGWAAFLVVMPGGIAALGVGFGEYLGAFFPYFSTSHVLWQLPLRRWSFTVNGGQLAGAIAIALLTAVNYIGVREGTGVQNLVTVVKIGSIVALAALGLFVPATATPQLAAPLPAGSLVTSLGVGMVAVLWSYDAWYAATNLAGEMRRPERELPIGLVAGAAVVTVLYLMMNLVYLRALPIEAMSGTSRIGEAAAGSLFGPLGARLLTLAVLVSSFGCISSNILFGARIYLPMAQDGLFFPTLARVHPRYRTPGACLLAQGGLSIALAFSGRYDQLYTYVMFAMVAFEAMMGAAVPLLRHTRPNAPRPYRVWGYPFVPAAFVLASLFVVVNTLLECPLESGIGLVLILLGFPAYAYWRRHGSAYAAPVVSAVRPTS